MKSPIRDNPLRNPGESLDRYLLEYKFDHLLSYMIMTLVLVIVALFQWLQHLMGTPPHPYLMSGLAFGAFVATSYKYRTVKRRSHAIRQGIAGEKTVGQYLERLREQRAQIFHDVPGDGFNVDHVAIHMSGVYVIETKTYSKPEEGQPTIRFDGERVRMGQRQSTSKPVTQVRAGANWISQILQESTGKKWPVRPVLVFPGWFVEPTAEARSSDVWVLNPKALPSFIEHSANQLTEEKVRLAAYHLSRFVRTYRES